MPDYRQTGEKRPTKRNYNALELAYDYFNGQLFEGSLPRCVITLQRKANSRGYFAPNRFGTPTGGEITHEIALNPSHFRERTPEEILSTLVHEMCHLQQEELTPGHKGYHDAEWGLMMKAVGLVPSATGEPGGKQTGQKMTHYIRKGGPFDRACARLIKELGWTLAFVELWGDPEKAKTKAASKTKYTCPGCELNAWGKPGIFICCGECEMRMEPPPEAAGTEPAGGQAGELQAA